MADFQKNPCEGAGWRTTPSGYVEIEGVGIPAVARSSGRFTNMERTWQNWRGPLTAAADEFDLPRSWVLAFATVETGHLSADPSLQANAVSPVGARGVMQIMPGRGGPFPNIDPEQLFIPQVNIFLAGKFIRESLVKRYGMQLPLLGAGYNAGSVRCSPGRNIFNLVEDHDYSRQLVEFSNAAIGELDLSAPIPWGWMAAGMVLVGAVGWMMLEGIPGHRAWFGGR